VEHFIFYNFGKKDFNLYKTISTISGIAMLKNENVDIAKIIVGKFNQKSFFITIQNYI
jgi:hypothetical protein